MGNVHFRHRENGISKSIGKKRAVCTKNYKQFHNGTAEIYCMRQEEKEKKPEVDGSQNVEGLACHARNLGLYLVRDREPFCSLINNIASQTGILISLQSVFDPKRPHDLLRDFRKIN